MRGLAFYANYSPQTRVARPLLLPIRPFCHRAPMHLPQSRLPWGNPLIAKTRNQTSLQLFFDWGLSPVPAKRKQSIIWTIYCVFEPISAFCRSATIPNRKKVATQADFLFSTFQNVIELTL